MNRIAGICLLLAFFTSEVSAQETCCFDLTPDQILVLVIDKAKNNDEFKQKNISYKEDYVRNEYNYKNELKSTEKSTSILEGKARKLAGFDLALGNLLEVLRNKHDFSFVDPGIVIFEGKPVVILKFQPKPNLQYPTTEDKFINRMRGELVIDATDLSLLQVNGQIPESDTFSFRAWWKGLVFVTVEVQSFSLSFKQTKYNDVAIEDTIAVTVRFKVLGSTRTRRYYYQYGDYRNR